MKCLNGTVFCIYFVHSIDTEDKLISLCTMYMYTFTCERKITWAIIIMKDRKCRTAGLCGGTNCITIKCYLTEKTLKFLEEWKSGIQGLKI